MLVAGCPTAIQLNGDQSLCNEWLPFARRRLEVLFSQANGGYRTKEFLVDGGAVRIRIACRGRFGKLWITAAEGGGIIVQPASKEHTHGWGSPFNANPPLGTVQGNDDANRVILMPKTKDPNPPIRVHQRGVKKKTGNLMCATRKGDTGNKYDIVTYVGPPSGWIYDTVNVLGEGFYSDTEYSKGPIDYARYHNYVYLNGKKIDTPMAVYAAKYVTVDVSGKKEKRLYVFGFDGPYLLKYTVNRKDWIDVWSTNNCLADEHITNDKWYPGGEPVTGTYKGKLRFYSIPVFNHDCTELNFLLCAQGIPDTSVKVAIGPSTNYNRLQKYVGILKKVGDNYTYEINRLDAYDSYTEESWPDPVDNYFVDTHTITAWKVGTDDSGHTVAYSGTATCTVTWLKITRYGSGISGTGESVTITGEPSGYSNIWNNAEAIYCADNGDLNKLYVNGNEGAYSAVSLGDMYSSSSDCIYEFSDGTSYNLGPAHSYGLPGPVIYTGSGEPSASNSWNPGAENYDEVEAWLNKCAGLTEDGTSQQYPNTASWIRETGTRFTSKLNLVMRIGTVALWDFHYTADYGSANEHTLRVPLFFNAQDSVCLHWTAPINDNVHPAYTLQRGGDTLKELVTTDWVGEYENAHPIGYVKDPRSSTMIFSCLVVKEYPTAPIDRYYKAFNYCSNGNLDTIIGIDIGAPGDTLVHYEPLNAF